MNAPATSITRLLETRRAYLLLVVFCLLLWLPGFFTIPPTDRDEARFAQATKQMLESGDFVRIRNGDIARNRKPIGIYWLQVPFAAAARAAGLATANPIWPYRIPSFLGGMIAVCSTFGLGQRLVGRRAALLGAAMLAASAVLIVETHIAKTDAALLAATTIAMGLLARAYLDPGGFRPAHAAGFWLALGAGILLKGPITPMVAALAVLALLIADRRAPRRAPGPAAWLGTLRPGWGVPLMLALVLPWFVAIGVATHGRFFAQAVGGDLGRKLAGGAEAHGAPPGFYLLTLPLTLFPAAFAVIAAIPAAWRARAEPGTRFLIAWAVPAWIVFEAVPTKLPHYVLPLFPPLCLLAAAFVVDQAWHAPPRWLRAVAVAAFAIAVAALGIAAAVLPFAVERGQVVQAQAALLGVPALLAAAIIAFLVLRSLRDWTRAVVLALAALPLLTWSVLGYELPRLQPLWIAPRVAAALKVHWPAGRPVDARFAAVGFAEPSLRFLCGTGTQMLDSGQAGARFLAGGPDRVVAVEQRALAPFEQAAAQLHVAPHAFATVRGFNYSKGHPVTLTLFDRPAPAR